MEKSILIGGFGGQGVQTLGKLLAYTANEMDIHVTFSPAYGGEMRGGTSNCTITVSDDVIGSPTKVSVDYVVAMNIESFKKFESRVKPGGTLIYNSTIIPLEPTRTDINVMKFPASGIAKELGSDKVLNIAAFGFIAAATPLVDVESARAILAEKLGKKEEFRAKNELAFDAGVKYAKENY